MLFSAYALKGHKMGVLQRVQGTANLKILVFLISLTIIVFIAPGLVHTMFIFFFGEIDLLEYRGWACRGTLVYLNEFVIMRSSLIECASRTTNYIVHIVVDPRVSFPAAYHFPSSPNFCC